MKEGETASQFNQRHDDTKHDLSILKILVKNKSQTNKNDSINDIFIDFTNSNIATGTAENPEHYYLYNDFGLVLYQHVQLSATKFNYLLT